MDSVQVRMLEEEVGINRLSMETELYIAILESQLMQCLKYVFDTRYLKCQFDWVMKEIYKVSQCFTM